MKRFQCHLCSSLIGSKVVVSGLPLLPAEALSLTPGEC
ncbi:hypothetical protein JL2886_03316 [Phaeobacter gallaeciensis]|uniref:Uncharacterized protein n=1 Tax=Phaeobacter gallaeciensis TaxID=60890 RepID=A0A1B0ZVJ6_9RHOB|nr:hypothetical protein JL2886_03316 [Phaeobacter gallaeciensis]